MKSEPFYSPAASVTYGQRQEPRKNDIPSESDGSEPKTKKKCLDLWPVMPSSSGEGLPYAPIDWPCPGDTWRWRVGNRISHTGFFCDRFLYPPALPQNSGWPKLVFGGRTPLERYIQTEFPDADVEAFFASFSWKVPAIKRDWPGKRSYITKNMKYRSKVSTAPLPRWRGKKDEDKEVEDEMVEARMKLSFLLTMDFPLLISTDNLTELTNLLSTLQKDSCLTLDQCLELQMIEEIPLNAKHFLEAKKYIEDVDDFFAELEEYNQSKLKTVQCQAEIDSNLSAIQEIDDQIVQLQSQRAKLSHDVDLKKVDKNELVSAQGKVTDSLSSIVQKVELGKSKKREWELKKANAAKRVAEILAKYESLKGFSL